MSTKVQACPTARQNDYERLSENCTCLLSSDVASSSSKLASPSSRLERESGALLAEELVCSAISHANSVMEHSPISGDGIDGECGIIGLYLCFEKQ